MTEVVDTKLERYKLQTEFSPDGRSIVHTTYKSSLESGVRRVVVKTRWYEARQLGFGGNGVVFLQRNADGQYRAVKRMYKVKGVNFSMELKALSKSLDREDLFVQFFGWFEDRQNLYIAMEFIKFGDLSLYINDPAMKHNARDIATQVLEGIDSLHKHRICHRDLKPQNILMASVAPVWVKIADFGCSKYLKDSSLETKHVGTQPYNAPELQGLGKEKPIYSNAIDLWSLGCIIHEMLTSRLVFSQASTAPATTSTMSTQPDTEEFGFDHGLLSSFCLEEDPKLPTELLEQAGAGCNAIHLIKSLLRVKPEERLTAESALRAPWIVEEGGPTAELTVPVSQIEGSSLEWIDPQIHVDSNKGPRSRALLSAYSEIPRMEREIRSAPSAGPQTKGSGTRDLIKAALEGDVRILSELLALKPDKEQRNGSGETALLAAVRAGKLQSVSLLLKHGANLGATLKDGSTALLVSVQAKNTEMAMLLLGHRVDIEQRGKDQCTALIAAASMGDLAMVSLLMKHGASLEAKQKHGLTALMIAAEMGDKAITELLLEGGATLEAKAKDQSTALILATSRGNTDVVGHLLDRGADMEARQAEAATPLITATPRGHLETAPMLLRRGSSVDIIIHNDRTPLLIAAMHGHLEIALMLLAHGAQINARTESGATPLLLAASNGHADIVAMLLDHGAGMEYSLNNSSVTAFLAAASKAHLETMTILLDRGVDITARDNQGSSALILAAWNGHTEVVEFLLGIGALVSETDSRGRTALTIAASNGYAAIVQLLLDAGSSMDKRSLTGETALMAALAGDHTETVALLQGTTGGFDAGGGDNGNVDIEAADSIQASPRLMSPLTGAAGVVVEARKKTTMVEGAQSPKGTVSTGASPAPRQDEDRVVSPKDAVSILEIPMQVSGGDGDRAIESVTNAVPSSGLVSSNNEILGAERTVSEDSLDSEDWYIPERLADNRIEIPDKLGAITAASETPSVDGGTLWNVLGMGTTGPGSNMMEAVDTVRGGGERGAPHRQATDSPPPHVPGTTVVGTYGNKNKLKKARTFIHNIFKV